MVQLGVATRMGWRPGGLRSIAAVAGRKSTSFPGAARGKFRALCREYGISAKTGYKWQERFLRDEVWFA
jgi:hypothetical protein